MNSNPNSSLTVVVGRVSQVGLQGLNGALAVHSGCGGKANESQHGQAAVLQQRTNTQELVNGGWLGRGAFWLA